MTQGETKEIECQSGPHPEIETETLVHAGSGRLGRARAAGEPGAARAARVAAAAARLGPAAARDWAVP